MSRSGVFYVVKAMERTVAGTAAAGAAGRPARQAADREAAAPARPDDGATSLIRRALAAVQHRVGVTPAAAGRGRRKLGGAARAD
jgi:hypothetical protein